MFYLHIRPVYFIQGRFSAACAVGIKIESSASEVEFDSLMREEACFSRRFPFWLKTDELETAEPKTRRARLLRGSEALVSLSTAGELACIKANAPGRCPSHNV